jgi:hypothetical protein
VLTEPQAATASARTGSRSIRGPRILISRELSPDPVRTVIAPYLAASATASPMRLIAGLSCTDAVALELAAVERLRQGHVWLRYEVRNGPGPDLFRVEPVAQSGFLDGLACALRTHCLVGRLLMHRDQDPGHGDGRPGALCGPPPRYPQPFP